MDRMDTTEDKPTVDYQSMYVSFEERRWIAKQRSEFKLDPVVKAVADFHKKISHHEYFSLLPPFTRSSPIITKPALSGENALYYPSVPHNYTDSDIDHFRLHHQQTFRSIYADLSTEFDYQIFLIIMEGVIFYASPIVNDYTSKCNHEIRRMLSDFTYFIQSRSKMIVELLSSLRDTGLPSYTMVHKHDQNNCGVLCQLLPKLHYDTDVASPYQSIVTKKCYETGTLSPEELRCIDYSMNLKHKLYGQQNTARVVRTSRSTNALSFGPTGSSTKFHILHSLPIIYPFNDVMVYNGKYPAFWTGDNHLNENSDRLFQSISIGKETAEYLFVQRMFHKTLATAEYQLISIERIQNPHLWEKFSAHRSQMRRKNRPEHINEQWFFHGTKSNNNQQIMGHGFNRSYSTDSVLYGLGVYFSRYAAYSARYTDGKELCFLFLNRVLVGHHTPGSTNLRVPPNIVLPDGRQQQADSTTDREEPYSMACTFHDDQNYPEFMISYMPK